MRPDRPNRDADCCGLSRPSSGGFPSAGSAAAVGLVITPLLDAITSTLRPAELADANSLFNICQRIAGAVGIGLIAALFAAWARTSGPVPALHDTGVILTAVAALATGAAALRCGGRRVRTGDLSTPR